MTFTLSLDKAPTTDLVISYAVDSSSTASLGNDFTVTAGTVTFAAGQTSAEVQVTVLGDLVDEADETIVLNFTNTDRVSSFSGTSSVKRVNDLKATGTIVDEDHSFVFTSPAAVSVAENTTAVVTVAGTDADTAIANLTATLSGPDAALFNLNSDRSVSFKTAPNFEAPADVGANNVYNVTLTVRDNDYSAVTQTWNSTSQNLVITVSDANEAPTALALTGQVASIAENTVLTASRKVADIVVTDDALGTETFTVGGADAASFEIVGTELHLKAGTALNFEAKTAYNVTVTAADAALTGSTPVTAAYALAVTNVNEAPVAVADTAVVITGNSVTIDVLANDTDPDNVAAFNTPSVTSATVASTSGTVAVVNNQLVFKAADGFQGPAVISYSITDGALTSSSTATVTVGEPALSAAAASANEGQNVVFNIKGVANTAYNVQIDSTNINEIGDGFVAVTTNAAGDATVTLATTADRSTEAAAQSVRANIVGTLAAPVSVSVADTSLNNTAPVAADAAATVAEGATATGQLVATDVDTQDAGDHTFSTTATVAGFALNANGSWTFDATNAAYNTLAVGQTSVQTITYTVNDNATDAGNGALTDTGVLTITVTGTNDVPTFTVAGGNVQTVNEGATAVTSFTTADVDVGNIVGEVQLSGEDAPLFQIVGNNLAFRTAPNFDVPTDANRDGIYNVTLSATDNNGGVGSQAVQITVADLQIGQTFNLTTGVDLSGSLVGSAGTTSTANNDTFNALNTTVNAFDNVNGGAGTDTLNYIDTSAALFGLPFGAPIAGIETVNVSRLATGALTGAFAITDATFGADVTTLSYTESSLAASMTAATAAVTLSNATNVSVASNSTGVFTTVAVTDSSATPTNKLTTVSIQGSTGAGTLTGNGISTLNLNTATGVQTVTATARPLTVNVSGTSGGGVTDATATTATINSSVTAAGAVGTFTTATATTVNYNTTTANGAGAAVITAAAATTLNVGGSAVATLALTGSTALTTVNVGGTAGLTVDLTAAATAVTALNFTNTAGTSTVTANLATAVTGGAGVEAITVGLSTGAINLGGGNDSLTLTGASLGVGGSANGGDGVDVLSMTTANAATASATTTFAPAVTGFEQLTLTTAATSAINLSQLGGYNFVTIANGANTLTLNNMASGGTVVIGGANTGVVMGGSLGAGVNDTLNLTLNNSTNALVAFGTVTATNVENIVVSVNDTQATPTPLVNTLSTLTIDDISMKTLTISGTEGLAITLANPATALVSFDASGLTSGVATGNTTNVGVNFTSSALTFASTAVGSLRGGDNLNFSAALAAATITATAGTNTITGSSTIGSTLNGGTGVDTIVGGAGNDTITVGASAAAITNSITGAAGADSITLTGSVGADSVLYGAAATAVGAAGVNMDTITNFATTVDKINLTVSAGTAGTSTLGLVGANTTTVGTMATPIAGAVSVATVAAVYTQLATDLVAANLAASATGAGNLVARVVTYASGDAAGTYLVVNDGVAGFQAANDLVIKLVGTTTVAAGDFAYTYVA
jgi:S-layer protein